LAGHQAMIEHLSDVAALNRTGTDQESKAR
jgi:hypothetical protein